jgi:hypothetical protein
MSGLGDSVTIGILLILIFGAVSFYLYSRMSQNEKRLSLLENLLLSLKMSTEASLMGPDSVEPVSNPAPLESEDVDEVEYSDMLKEIPASAASTSSRSPTPTANAAASAQASAEEEEESAAALLRSMEPAEPVGQVATQSERKMDANYESMSVKELQSLARQRGLTGVAQRKRDLIDALKKQGGAPPTAPTPLDTSSEGFEVGLEESIDN